MKKIISIIVSLSCLAAFTSCGKPVEEVPAMATVTSAAETTETTTVTTVTTTETTTVITEPEPEFATVSIAAVGDNLIHSSIYNQAAARSTDGGYDFTYAYENAVSLIRDADMAIINQETLICNDQYEPSTYPRFNSPVALGDHMLEIGFDVFTIANNHTLDKNEDGLMACLDYWDSRENAIVAGAYRNAEDRADIRTGEFEGITFSFLSYTEYLNGLYLPEGSVMEIGDAFDVETMVKEITAAKEISDVCVVALHWGVENSDIISDYQRSTAKQLVDAGADIIIGNHPHVLRDIEEIEREDGTTALCAYSLGNFISAQSVGQNLIGGVLNFDVTMRVDENAEENQRPIIDNIEFIPVITHYDGNYHDVRVYPLNMYTRELADSHGVKSMSKFGYEYIFEVLDRNINDKYFDASEYYVAE
ncbi:MAG: CapA family protein [Oscillospiraceae bacterium]|nr:CapA family protein [Oscillospiraceae bacterium]